MSMKTEAFKSSVKHKLTRLSLSMPSYPGIPTMVNDNIHGVYYHAGSVDLIIDELEITIKALNDTIAKVNARAEEIATINLKQILLNKDQEMTIECITQSHNELLQDREELIEKVDELTKDRDTLLEALVDNKLNKYTAHWGTYGKNQTGPYKIKRLIDLETDHLLAILDTEVWHLKDDYIAIIYQILAERDASIPGKLALRKAGDKPIYLFREKKQNGETIRSNSR